LSRLRWLGLFGQLVTVLITSLVLHFPLPLELCLAVIGLSALLNLVLNRLVSKTLLLNDGPAAALLGFDILQLTSLLYLTGGLENPFAMLFLAPATIAAVSLPPRQILLITALTGIMASFLYLNHYPLPWYQGQSFTLPPLYRTGFWLAILISCAFISAYASRVAFEARSLSTALTATELALEHQNHLSQLDGLAAAAAHELGTPLATIALVVRELGNLELPAECAEDLALLAQESQRCRSILGRLASLASENLGPLAQTTLTIMLEQIAAPYRHGPVELRIDTSGEGPEPLASNSPAIEYALSNLIDNAVDFARSLTIIEAKWTDEFVTIAVLDDGPGFSAEVIKRIGEPYVTTRSDRRTKTEEGSGLGLGVFIAKTLLERGGGKMHFANRAPTGASLRITWSRKDFEKLSAG
jgi:two-component system sensor histidine kinase RegB